MDGIGAFLTCTLIIKENMSKQPFFEENERITNALRIAGVQSTEQSAIRGIKIPFDPKTQSSV